MSILAILGGIAASAASTALGSAASSHSQNQANKQQNEMFDKQKEFWYDQQEYNSPENQVQRFRDAGINPNFALGNISSGQMGTTPTAAPGAAPMANMANISDSVLSILRGRNESNLAKANENLLSQDATLKEIDGYTRGLENITRIAEIVSRTDKNKGEALLSRVQADATDFLSTMQYNKGLAETEKIASEVEINWLNYAKGLQELQFLPVQQRLSYLERMASIAKMKAETSSEKQRKLKLIQETNHEYFKSKGQKFVNQLNNKIENYLVGKAKWEAIPQGMRQFDYIGEGFNNAVDSYLK